MFIPSSAAKRVVDRRRVRSLRTDGSRSRRTVVKYDIVVEDSDGEEHLVPDIDRGLVPSHLLQRESSMDDSPGPWDPSPPTTTSV